MHKIFWDFEIWTDHRSSSRKLDKEIINNKNCRIVDFTLPVGQRGKIKENKKRDKFLDLARELKKSYMLEL